MPAVDILSDQMPGSPQRYSWRLCFGPWPAAPRRGHCDPQEALTRCRRYLGALIAGSASIISRNLTPDKIGMPARGRPFAQFLNIMRTPVDLDHLHSQCAAGSVAINCIPAPLQRGAVMGALASVGRPGTSVSLDIFRLASRCPETSQRIDKLAVGRSRRNAGPC